MSGLRLRAGGALDPERDLYIERLEDGEILRCLLAGDYVNILTSRQMGKSSLMESAIPRLEAAGVACAAVDMAGDLENVGTAEAYVRALVGRIARELGVEFDARSWWPAAEGETANQKLLAFFRDVVAEQVPGPVVVFLDEIDSSLKYGFTDGLFTALRAMYNARPREAAYRRITVCLLGVAAPNELIKDRRTTPYNVGRTFELRDFERGRDDLGPLDRAVAADPEQGRAIVDRVMHWTGGHPYLTFKLAADLRDAGAKAPEAVDALVDDAYATLEQVGADVHFQQILRFVETRLSDGLASLRLYERILAGRREQDLPTLAHTELKLSGLVKRDAAGFLVVRNRLYRRLYGPRWVAARAPVRRARRRKQVAAAVSLMLVVGIGGLTVTTLQLGRELQVAETAVAERGEALAAKQRQLDARRTLEDLGVTLQAAASGTGLVAEMPADRAHEILPEAARAFADLEPPVTELDLSGTRVRDLTPLAGLTALRELRARETAVSDVTPLATLGALSGLDLSQTAVADVTALANARALEWLSLAGTAVTDVAPLAGLPALRFLDLSATPVADVAPLRDLRTLAVLVVSDPHVDDVSALADLRGLRIILNRVSIRKPEVDDAMPVPQTFRDCDICPEMVVVPAGRFLMGSPPDEAGRFSDEGPRHPVDVRRFAIGRFEVTYAEYAAFLNAVGRRGRPDEPWFESRRDQLERGETSSWPSRLVIGPDGRWMVEAGHANDPVAWVTWFGARAYADWLSERTGQRYRLPSEAEWEYAARAGTTTARFWGDDPDAGCVWANAADETARIRFPGWSVADCFDGYLEAAPVGSFAPNPLGLHDMLGNVWEWVADCSNDTYEGAPGDGTVREDGDCYGRVLRGGSWHFDPGSVRSAYRLWNRPGYRNYSGGFRVARTLF